MILQGGRLVARLPQPRVQCIANRPSRSSLSPFQRVVALYHSLRSHKASDSTFPDSLPIPTWSRGYATKPVSRPKAHTGRTTTAARKAPTTSKTKAAKKPAIKKTSAKAIPKGKATAKPRIKPKPKTAKKAKKAKPKKKSTKAKPKKKTKKVLTEDQKKAATIKSLKNAALSPPTQLVSTAWTVLSAESVKGAKLEGMSLGERVKEASTKFKNLSPEQLEHYNHIANQNKAANAIAYRQWIESYSPSDIHTANNARRALKRRGVSKHANPLQDHRQVKGFRNAYNVFFTERYSSGDFKGLKIPEAARLAGREWKALSPSEKKSYEDAAKQDHARYVQEMSTVFNKNVTSLPKTAEAA